MTLPTRRERLRAFCRMKLENRRLRIALFVLAAAALALLAALLLRPEPPATVPLGTGLAGVDSAAVPPPPASVPEPEPAPEPAPAPEPPAASERSAGEGEASYYGDELAGRPTASGERFDPGGLTAAHRSLPLGSKVRVTHARSGRSVVVRINDRGPFHGNRVIDLSTAAARQLGMLSAGRARVRLALLT